MEILTIIISAISGGVLFQLFTLKSQRKKATVEAQQLISEYYQKEISFLTGRIDELYREVRTLTDQLKYCKNCNLNEKK